MATVDELAEEAKQATTPEQLAAIEAQAEGRKGVTDAVAKRRAELAPAPPDAGQAPPSGRHGATTDDSVPSSTPAVDPTVRSADQTTPTLPQGVVTTDPEAAESARHQVAGQVVMVPANMAEAQAELAAAAAEGRTALVEIVPPAAADITRGNAPMANQGGVNQQRRSTIDIAQPAPLPRPDDPDLMRGTEQRRTQAERERLAARKAEEDSGRR